MRGGWQTHVMILMAVGVLVLVWSFYGEAPPSVDLVRRSSSSEPMYVVVSSTNTLAVRVRDRLRSEEVQALIDKGFHVNIKRR